MTPQQNSDRSAQNSSTQNADDLKTTSLGQEHLTEEIDALAEAEPLAAGYVYVDDSLDANQLDGAEDDSLSRQLFFNGTEVEKRTIKDVIEDHNYNRALEREQKLYEKEVQREAEILAGIQAMRAERARAEERDRLGLAPEDEDQEENSKKPLLIGALSLAGLLLAGGAIVFALGSQNSQREVNTTVSTSPTASVSPSASAAPSLAQAPVPSFNSKVPEVNYLESTVVAVDPGTVEYMTTEAPAPVETYLPPVVEETAPVATLAPAPVQTAEVAPTTPVAETTSAEPSESASPSAEPTAAETSAAPTQAATLAPSAAATAPVVGPSNPAEKVQPTSAPAQNQSAPASNTTVENQTQNQPQTQNQDQNQSQTQSAN